MLSKRGVLVTQSERRLRVEKQGEGGRQNPLLQSVGGFLTILAVSSFLRFTLGLVFETISAFTEVSSSE